METSKLAYKFNSGIYAIAIDTHPFVVCVSSVGCYLAHKSTLKPNQALRNTLNGSNVMLFCFTKFKLTNVNQTFRIGIISYYLESMQTRTHIHIHLFSNSESFSEFWICFKVVQWENRKKKMARDKLWRANIINIADWNFRYVCVYKCVFVSIVSLWVLVKMWKLNWKWNSIWLQTPQDRTIIRRVLRTVSLSLFVCMSTISGCGILVAIALIVFNIWNNHRRWVLLSYCATAALAIATVPSGSITMHCGYSNIAISIDDGDGILCVFFCHWNVCMCVCLVPFLQCDSAVASRV